MAEESSEKGATVTPGHPPLSQPAIDAASSVFWEAPWCAKLLKDPSLTPRPTTRGFDVSQNDQDSFFSRTLATKEAIRAHVTLVPREYARQSYPRIQENIKLFALGPLLSGHERVAHGGLVATVLDETLGILIYLNEDAEADANPDYEFKHVMTLTLNMSYRKPVLVPGTVLGRAWFEKIDGRKRWIKGTLEDGGGNILTEAEALFIELKTTKM